jgi:predicted Zn finger-like uncharacterized protein
MPNAGSLPLFDCPTCQAVYRVVEAEAGPETIDGDVPCRRCGGFLPGRKGEHVLKYFYVRGGATRRQNNLSLAPAIHHASNLIPAA